MLKLDDLGKVARRAQDIQTGLRDVSDPIVSATIPVTGQIGMAALLAVHVRGLDVISNIPGFYRLAESLGIPGPVLPLVLTTLEEAGWVRVTPNAFNPKKVEESVPVFQELYGSLGQQWKARDPGELEVATVALVEHLAVAPIPADDAQALVGLDGEALTRVAEIGDLGGYMREYVSPGERRRILFTPLFMDEHPERILNFLAKHSPEESEIRQVFSEASAKPGLPVSDLEKTLPIVVEMVNANVIAAPAVESSGGRHSFLFPQTHAGIDSAVLNKARILLACVRYGERFSTITNVADVPYLLQRLRDTKKIGRTPHSNIGTQYQPAQDIGLGYIETTDGGRYRFHLYETPDNLAAVDLAITLASGATEPPAHKLLADNEVRSTISAESVKGVLLPAANRYRAREARQARRLDPRTKTAQRLQAELLDDLRGVHRVK